MSIQFKADEDQKPRVEPPVLKLLEQLDFASAKLLVEAGVELLDGKHANFMHRLLENVFRCDQLVDLAVLYLSSVVIVLIQVLTSNVDTRLILIRRVISTLSCSTHCTKL